MFLSREIFENELNTPNFQIILNLKRGILPPKAREFSLIYTILSLGATQKFKFQT